MGSVDRGKDVASAPWFKLGPTYGEPEGTRINDHHTTLAEKKGGAGATACWSGTFAVISDWWATVSTREFVAPC
jgi:hypothetical protein